MDAQVEEAKAIVRVFVQGRWKDTYWKDLIGDRDRPGGCLIDVLGLKCPKQKQRDAISVDGQEAIRQRHPNLFPDERTWNAKKANWKDEEISEIVSIVERIAEAKGIFRKANAEMARPDSD
jgi:hypothetical protein